MKLRVASLNIWALPFGLAPGATGRINAIAQRLPSVNADVIGLQEVWTPIARQTLVDGGRQAGFKAIWHRPMSFGGSGLLVLSKLPILESHFTAFNVRGSPERLDHSDYHGGKGFIRLVLETPTGPIQVINTHLHARYARSTESDIYLGVRAAQATQIALAINRAQGPVIAMGDFNLQEGEPEYRILLGLTGLRDAAVVTNQRQATISAENPYRRQQAGASEERIDYVFARGGPKRGLQINGTQRIFDGPLEIDGREATYSDHAGIGVDLVLDQNPLPRSPIDPGAIAEARKLLQSGMQSTEHKGRSQRIIGIAAIAGAIGSWSLARGMTRRAWLRFLLRGVGLTSAAAGAGFGWLGLEASPSEAESYQRLLAELDSHPAGKPKQTGLLPANPAAFADPECGSGPKLRQSRHPDAPSAKERA